MSIYDLNTVRQQVGDYAKKRYGYTPTEEDYGQVAQDIGYSGQSDFNFDEAALQGALGSVDRHAAGRTAEPKAQQPGQSPGASYSPVLPNGQISPGYGGVQSPQQQAQAQAQRQRLDPKQTGTLDQAIQYLSGQGRNVLGRDLQDADWQKLQEFALHNGWDTQGGKITGDMVNQALDAMEKWGGGGGGGGQYNPIGNSRWTPGTFEAFPTRRLDFKGLLDKYGDMFNAGDAYEATKTGGFGRYNPYQFSMYTAPNQEAEEGAQIGALMQALGHSEWSPERVAAQKEVQKEQALGMQQQLQEQIGERFAGAGRSGAGAEESSLRRVGQATASDILGSYRDIDENAANARRQELLATAGALGEALSGQSARRAQGYLTGLEGQKAQAGENRGAFGANLEAQMGEKDDQYRGFTSRFMPWELALRSALGESAADQDYNQLDWLKEQFAQNFPEDQRQFNISSMLDLIRILEGQRQFNEGLGLDWTKFNWDSFFGGR